MPQRIALTIVIGWFSCSGGSFAVFAEERPPFGFRMDLKTFQELRSLAPEMPQARWPGLAAEGQRAWERGELAAVYNTGYYLQEDFNADGQPDAALLLEAPQEAAASRRYLLLATRRAPGLPWSRVQLLRLPPALQGLAVNEILEQLSADKDSEAAAFLTKRVPPMGRFSDEARKESAAGAVRPLREWVARLGDEDPLVRLEATEALGEQGQEAHSAIEPLVQRLYDSEELIRNAAVRSLQRIGPESVPALRVLVEREGATFGRHDSGARAQRLAVHLLGDLVPVTDEAVALAAGVCRQRAIHDVVRHDACVSLGQLGQQEPRVREEAVRALLSVFQETDAEPYLRSELVYGLGRLGPDSAILTAFAQALQDSDAFIRRAVIGELGKFGAAAQGVLPELEAALADPDAEVRAPAQNAIDRITASRAR